MIGSKENALPAAPFVLVVVVAPPCCDVSPEIVITDSFVVISVLFTATTVTGIAAETVVVVTADKIVVVTGLHKLGSVNNGIVFGSVALVS